MRAKREHGGGGAANISVNLHKRVDDRCWQAFARPAKRLRIGDEIRFSPQLKAIVENKGDGGEVLLQFNLELNELSQAFQRFGEIPLPPYIGSKRKLDERDVADYQTVYADRSGSVAAPTAGLHFTDAMLKQLQSKGILSCYLTLHVGAGTFLPVNVDDTKAHIMHHEWREISQSSADMINSARAEGRRIIAVGTTSLRSLESAANESGEVIAQSGETDIFITPGYSFKVVDGLLTNFHLPRSTLFMLVSAFCGLEKMHYAYDHAIDSGYRFYSYGDACLLWRNNR
jgi:S-adenosylmethionine:tRNA ribosyltransferase-isomerase